jgi:hypothetical protein
MKKPDLYTLIQVGDIVTPSKIGLSYLGQEYEGQAFEVIAHNPCFETKKDCQVETGQSSKNCICWKYFSIKSLKNGEIIKDAIFDELNIVDLKKVVQNEL